MHPSVLWQGIKQHHRTLKNKPPALRITQNWNKRECTPIFKQDYNGWAVAHLLGSKDHRDHTLWLGGLGALVD